MSKDPLQPRTRPVEVAQSSPTRALYGVFGNPVKHSLSPQIHTQFAQQTQQALAYQAILAPLDQFAQAVEQFKQQGGAGFNVTIPFKQEAWALADQHSDFAKRAGAVNTIWFDQQGQMLSDNTDGRGLLRDILNNQHQTIAGKRLLILGAGGAARGILQPLLEEKPQRCVIVNRTFSRAEELASSFSDLAPIKAYEYEQLAGSSFDLIINASSSSLSGDLPPLPENILAENAFCYDLMYGKEPTPFQQWAIGQGAQKAVDGLGMLVEQAAESFFIWTGVRPQTESIISSFRS